MASDINTQINARVQSFVTELSDLVRIGALEAVLAALGKDAASKRRGPGRPRAADANPAAAGKPKRRAKGARRSSGDVDATMAKFLAFVKANDGKRLEEISKALGIHSADLKLPVQKLLAAKAVKTTGQKRGTKYHVAGKAGSKPKRARVAKRAKKSAKRAKAAAPKAKAGPATPQPGIAAA